MASRDLRFTILSGMLAAWAVVPVVAVVSRAAWLSDYRLWLLVCAAAVSEFLAVVLSSEGSISITYPLLVAATVLFGPAAGSMVAVASIFPVLFSKPRISASKFCFNLGQFILTALVPGTVYLLCGGRMLASAPLGSSDFPQLLLPLLLAGVLGIVVNFVLYAIGLKLLYQTTFRSSWESTFFWMLPSQVALGLVGIAIAQIMSVLGAVGFALFAIPLVVARQVHERYVELREAYADGVRSLVGALEAKDPYTKGHSVRVAEYATALAREMGLKDRAVEQVEYAALLHDLGKVGISEDILHKPARLSEEERDEIRKHPEIAARILESVPFLDGVQPAVEFHHERFDGMGYCRGLEGESIPLAARILAVADSFDAMTCERPYRSALSPEKAMEELVRHSGSQFDEGAVTAFVRVFAAVSPESSGSTSDVSRGVLSNA